ncbi:MAG: MlaD family protein [Myxococcota bacterium]
MNQSRADWLAGLFVLGAIGLALWATLRVGTTPDWLAGPSRVFSARFEDVTGLAPQTRVSIAGVSVGEVSRIVLDDARARVEIRLTDDRVRIPVDSIVAIRSRGLLGEKVLEIHPGRSQQMLEPGGVLTRTVSTGSIDKLVDRLTAVADDVQQVTASFRNVLGGGEGEETIREIVANARSATGDLQAIIADNKEHILRVATNLDAFSSDLSRLSRENREDVTATIHSFRNSSKRLESALDHLADLSERIDSGQGTVGRLLADDEIYKEIDATVKDARAALREVRRAAEETQEQVPATILTTLFGSLF